MADKSLDEVYKKNIRKRVIDDEKNRREQIKSMKEKIQAYTLHKAREVQTIHEQTKAYIHQQAEIAKSSQARERSREVLER